MNEIVPPVYAALTCVFVGLMLGNLAQNRSRMGAVSGGLAALGCLFVAVLPFIGRIGLVLATAMVLCSLTAMGLRIRNWRLALRRQQIWMAFGCVAVGSLLNMVIVAMAVSVQLRVVYQGLLGNAVLLYVIYGLWKLDTDKPSVQLKVMWVTLPLMMVVLTFWLWVVYEQVVYGGVVMFNTQLNEPWMAFVLRLFWIALLILAHVGAQGYELEREVQIQKRTTQENQVVNSLNQQLNQLLNEKNEMLQALSFAARSQNLPAIMSSLAHEINQPLGAIRLNADYLLAEDASLIPLERAQLLQQLVAGSTAATEVVRDFRRFLEVDITLHVQVDLSQLLADLVRGFQAEFGRQRVHVSLLVSEAVMVQGDPVQLESALSGTLLYVLKRSSPNVRYMQITTTCIGSFVHLRFLDDGLPITSAQLAEALDRGTQHFSQSIWLSRAIIEHHGGAMNVYEQNGLFGMSLQLPFQEKKS